MDVQHLPAVIDEQLDNARAASSGAIPPSRPSRDAIEGSAVVLRVATGFVGR